MTFVVICHSFNVTFGSLYPYLILGVHHVVRQNNLLNCKCPRSVWVYRLIIVNCFIRLSGICKSDEYPCSNGRCIPESLQQCTTSNTYGDYSDCGERGVSIGCGYNALLTYLVTGGIVLITVTLACFIRCWVKSRRFFWSRYTSLQVFNDYCKKVVWWSLWKQT